MEAETLKYNRIHAIIGLFFCTMTIFGLSACSQQTDQAANGKFQIIATTSIVGDVVHQIGGEHINVEILLPLGTDPHSFTPTPQDIARLSQADLVFANGAGLEEFLKPALESAGVSVQLIEVSIGVILRQINPSDAISPTGARQETQGDDPHTWLDPNNVMIWADNIASALTVLDPSHALDYQNSARQYQIQLTELDGWIRAQVLLIPAGGRKLVTDHLVLGYFADRYGFTQIGAIVPGFSSQAEPSAQEIARLEDAIIQASARAVFINWSLNSSLADRVAEDTGTRVVRLYTHSITEPGGEADNYLDLMRYDVTAIVDALK
jgi:ABC-type Zn uptake system ZnuABC Zn-binding protein ZnuA